MSERVLEKQYREPIDMVLLVSIMLLLGIGLTMLFSASFNEGIEEHGSSCFFFKRQIFMFVIGALWAVCCAFASLFNISFKKLIPVATLLIIAVCFIVAFTGPSVNGAKRWIRLGPISLQMSEFLKVYMVYFLAVKLNSKDLSKSSYIITGIILAVGCFSVFVQKDLSTSVFIACLGISMFLVSDCKKRYVILTVLILAVIGALMIVSSPYRMERIRTFLNPAADVHGSGYQVAKAIETISSGNFWGKGLCCSTYKLGILPEAKSDYIFAVVCEEMGLIGVFLILVLFLAFIVRGYQIACTCLDKYRAYVAFGFTTCVFFQAMANIMIVAGIFPSTGIPLPFFSQGGSSMCCTVYMCCMLIKISGEREKTGGKR